MNICAIVSSHRNMQEKRADQSQVDVTEDNKVSLGQLAADMEPSSSPGNGDTGPRSTELDMEEKNFISRLYRFMEERNTPIERIPHLGFKQINLWRIYKAVEKLGGYDSVTARRLWKNVYDELGGSPGSTSAATCTRRHYERLVLPFERQLRGEEDKPLPQAKPRKQYKKSPDGKGNKVEGRRKRSHNEEARLVVEEKLEDGALCDRGLRARSVSWSLQGANPQLALSTAKDTPTPTYAVPQPSSVLPVGIPLSPGEVISPLEKKKRMAQASLSLSKLCCSPEKGSGERPSVIHCAQSPEPPRSSRLHGSSEGSPLPRSSPSSYRSSSPCSVSSDDCQAVLEGSTPAPDPPPPPPQAPPTYLGNFTSTPYSGVCKPLSCYPSIKESAGYLGQRRDFLQVQPAGAKTQRPDLTWSPGCKGEDRLTGTLKPLQTSSSGCPSVATKACRDPLMSSFTKVLPKSQRPVAFQPGYKLQSFPNLKRPSSEEMAARGKKLQLVPPLHQGTLKEKFKPARPSPLPTQPSVFYPHASMPVSYLVQSYDKGRPISGHQLKGLSLQPLIVPAHLPLPSAQPAYPHITAGAAYAVSHPCPYPLPIWPPQTGYTVASLHPQYPNTKL